MIGCTRCGQWHTRAEEARGKKLSCTEVKHYWARVRRQHRDRFGHMAQITTDGSGNWVCLKCNRLL